MDKLKISGTTPMFTYTVSLLLTLKIQLPSNEKLVNIYGENIYGQCLLENDLVL